MSVAPSFEPTASPALLSEAGRTDLQPPAPRPHSPQPPRAAGHGPVPAGVRLEGAAHLVEHDAAGRRSMEAQPGKQAEGELRTAGGGALGLTVTAKGGGRAEHKSAPGVCA